MVRRCWMKEVRELSYDIEDCIDHYEHATAAGSHSVPNISCRKLSRRPWNNTPLVPEKLKQRLWMANKIREFSMRAQDALLRHTMYNNLSGISSTAYTTRGDVCSNTPSHPTQFKVHVDNVGSVGTDPDGMEAILMNELNKLKNLLAGIPTASLMQFREHINKVHVIHAHMEAILNNLENMPPGITTASNSSRQPTKFQEHANYVHHVGIDAAMNKIQNWLTVCGEEKLKVVSIMGVGGIGKTTLANELYRKLRWQFECRAFVRTSQKTDMRRLLVNILSQVCPHQRPDNWKVHSLISSIRTHLQDKRYLIIVEDLWATSTWDIIKCALPESNSSSRILTTTEIEDLALQSCSYDSKYIFKMKPLCEDDSRNLFFSTVFGSRSNCPAELSEASYDIVRKCGGLPLAVVTIAGLLASQLEKQEQWDYINKTLGHSLMANPNLEGMKQLLSLCHNNLPQHLKACMLYLSMYQEDFVIWKDDLVNQWIAEGFICAIGGDDKEEISKAYVDELVGRKLIQPVLINDNDEVLSCVVHRVVLNFITCKSIEENFIIAIDHSLETTRFADKVRRLSIHFGSVENATPPTNMRLSQVRTVAFWGVLNYMPFIMEFRLLKVLALHFLGDEDGIISFDLTKILGLVRLRYLKVSTNVTLKLPTQIQGLQYLETLKIDGKIEAVPSDIIYLPGLLHLSLPAKTNLPNGIAHMALLRTLGYFDLSCNSAENLWSLGGLTNLRDLQLVCSDIHSDNLKNNIKYLGSILGKLRNLKSITLSLGGYSYVNTPHKDNATSMRIFVGGWSNMSSVPAFLERFEFLPCVCIFSSRPNWIGQLGNLCILKIGIREVTSCDVDVLGGLLALTVLSLHVHTKPAESIVFGNIGFSILKYFKFRCCVAWMKFEVGAMPNLQKLKLDFNVHRADRLDTIPVGIEHVSRLEEISAKIRVSCAADDFSKRFAESALTKAIRMHPGRPSVNIRCVDWTFDGEDDDNVGIRKKLPREKRQVRMNCMEDDGFTWMKYGQKDIPGAMCPRTYFRCTHQSMKGCQATKHVQRTNDDLLLVDVVYYGAHTCGDIAHSDNQMSLRSAEIHSSNLQEIQESPDLWLNGPEQSTIYNDDDLPHHNKQPEKTVEKRTTQVRVSSMQDIAPLDDGYSWRKYGQKDILGAKYPISYYRCTHTFYGCGAKKKVQRTDGDPLLFDVEYKGVHTCHDKAHVSPRRPSPPQSTTCRVPHPKDDDNDD
uniref:WRKY domain-containing protein n=1 Tax=Leersia perrieri TaxID=77586 RepID=A0A0D9XVD4_9ORYZ